MKLTRISDVVAYQQCCGCGACAWAEPGTYEMDDVFDQGLRPRVKPGSAEGSQAATALEVCPGIGLSHPVRDAEGILEELRAGWGPVLEVWEGYATDPDLRFRASSGGAASALALHRMESGHAHGTLHIRARPDQPHLNETVLSVDRAQLLSAVGSRYAPASPCERLDLIERAPAPCVLIGKPCDVAAAGLAARRSDALAENLGLTISIFCAGTPSTKGTLAMLQRMGIEDTKDLAEVRYRGHGWPGDAAGRRRGEEEVQERRLSYAESWGDILSSHVQWRCRVCADHTGEFADVSVGDPWYRDIAPGDPGRSLIVVRSHRGQAAVRQAREAGYLTCEPVAASLLPASQPNLLRARGANAARIAVLRLLGLPAPRYRGFPAWRFWRRELSLVGKLRSLTGTVRRVIRRGLYKRLEI